MSDPLSSALAGLHARRRDFPAGARVFHQDGAVHMLHRVVEGEVHLVRNREDGGALVLQRAQVGDLVAEASLFSPRYHCDGVAVAPTVTMAYDRVALRRRLWDDPAVAEAWAAHLAHQVQAARQRAEIVSLRTVAERLDAWLAAHGGEFPDKGGWISLARELAVSPEALYRELARRR